MDKIAESCPSEVWEIGWASHFLGFMDFFNKNVQNTIMDLVLKVIKEFWSLNQWNEEVKQCVSLIIGNWARLGLKDGDILKKNLEWLSTFLQSLLNCRAEELSIESDSSVEQSQNSRRIFQNMRLNYSYLFTNQESQKSPCPKVIEIYNEMFENQSWILNFMHMLKSKCNFNCI